MNTCLKFLLIIFSMFLSLSIGSNSIQAQPVDVRGYIQDIKQETVVLVSNNILGGEISASEEKNQSNFVGNSPVILSFDYVNNFFIDNKTQLNGCFIHNLSTNIKKIQPIRAP